MNEKRKIAAIYLADAKCFQEMLKWERRLITKAEKFHCDDIQFN